MTDSGTAAPSPRKATIICDDCGFRAHVDDWTVSRNRGRRDVTCPVCGRVAVSQPVLGLTA